jgi:ABC-type Na+ efflux pump permease subunit
MWAYYSFKHIKYHTKVLTKTVVEERVYSVSKISTTPHHQEPLFLIFSMVSIFLLMFVVYLAYKIIRR